VADVPILKPREVAAILEQLGFVEVRQRRHSDGRATTVPFHARDISPSLLRKIARDIGLDVRAFLSSL
jgi:predicted RNA binding protein YcfA (HicA-like mRNA interferase family)